MQFQYSPYILPLIAAALISGWVAVYSWSRRESAAASALALLALAVVEWSLGYALEIAGADIFTKVFWGKSQYLAIVLVPVLWVGFAFDHANRARRLTPRTLILLSIVPMITFALVLTTESHRLIWSKIAVMESGNFSALSVSYGFWFWIHTLYSYLLLLIGTVIVIRSISRMKGIYRGQAAMLLLAVAAPWIGNFIYLSGLSPIPNLDLTPFAFTITVFAFTWGIFGFQLIDLSPIARATVIDEMSTGMMVLDSANRIADINPAALSIIRKAESEVMGRKAVDVLAAWPDITRKYARVMEAVDEIAIANSETRSWYELRLSPLHNRLNDFVGRVITITDITDRKRTEFRLLESEARYRQIVENASDIIYRTDSEGRFTYANPTVLRLMGFSSETDILGRHYLEFVAPHLRQDMKRFYERQFRVKETNTYHELPVITADGREIWLGQNVQTISKGGQIVSFQAVARDITELKRAQEALALARDQALEASRLKSQLLAKVSHELRTPLGGILGYAELLQMNQFGIINEKQKQAVAQVIDSVHYLSKMIDDLLDEGQIEARMIRLNFERFDPSELMKEIRNHMEVTTRQKHLEFVTSIAPDLPRILFGDEQRLQQILINLVANAVKFTNTGNVKLEFLRPDRTHWAMRVSDTGIGIPEEKFSVIFEPFHQLENRIIYSNRGTGLGLSITSQLVELMGGQIAVESEVGHGSTFTVTLPMQGVLEENHA